MPPAPGTPPGIGFSPVKPMNSAVPASSKAHSPNPWWSKRASMTFTRESLAARSRVAGKYRITSGSAFSAANGARSASRQRRMSSRPVRMVSNRRPTGPA